MTPNRSWKLRVLTLAALGLLLTGCAGSLQPSQLPIVVEPAQVPALPAQARQPERPSICWPTCSSGLMMLRESWQKLLTEAVKPEQPVSGSLTP